ncbi:hypothetical protein POL68_17975 [Stigmatella sp. ncwal1]|uniref:Uncharacterized protein n=1 Tax=Stigmatella ashevillensis TaxID=2995309 RepID=A0ABT5D9K5_9BACT|nr:hypothetical protein [Stigmatella ashevillena]MDC0710370.1 hypothetical protein [Stigmatella ashevillena]
MAYDRFLDVHVTGRAYDRQGKEVEIYDFADGIIEQARYVVDAHYNGVRGMEFMFIWQAPGARKKDTYYPSKNASGQGGDSFQVTNTLNTLSEKNDNWLGSRKYIAIGISISDIDNATHDPNVDRLVKWVSARGIKGKIRFNCHGDGKGHLFMGEKEMPGGRTEELKTTGTQVAQWLTANGLPPTSGGFASWMSSGLKTITLALCRGARKGKDTVNIKKKFYEFYRKRNTESATGSVAKDLVLKLRSNGCKGIEVTGSGEKVAFLKTGQLGREYEIPSEWPTVQTKHNGKERTICITLPDHCSASSRSSVLLEAEIEKQNPWDCRIKEKGKSKGWKLGAEWKAKEIEDEGKKVTKVEITPPPGWSVITAEGKAKLVIKKNSADLEVLKRSTSKSIWERLAHTEHKSSEIS